MTDSAVRCPTQTTSKCAEGVYYDDTNSQLRIRVTPPEDVQDVQHAIEILSSSGVQGAGGAQGAQGSVGAQGAQGAQGSVGAQGAQGSVGAQGAQGSIGAQGAQGAQGSVGAQGATGPSFGTEGFHARIGGTTGVNNAIPTTIIFDDDSTMGANDPGGNYDTTTGRFTVPVTGYYDTSASTTWAIGATGDRETTILYFPGGTGAPIEIAYDGRKANDNINGENRQSVAASHVELSAGDEVVVQVFQNSGISVDLLVARFGASRIG